MTTWSTRTADALVLVEPDAHTVRTVRRVGVALTVKSRLVEVDDEDDHGD